ncbi:MULTISPECIES: (2Fe-2S)-binding protein [Lysobacter]|uniref:(2Fe-2S)-binding protein n=1 Tax=Lysobacter firmicutimachus TaxID=1792846 RepID=A0ABU8D878_9GAMM|nr:(2Fe-2S)-binding protein [Lysobacter antibioticus]
MSADADTQGLRSRPLRLTVNGRAYGPVEVPDDMMLIDVLHEYLGLTGTRFGCGQGVCRACTVIVDDERGPREVRSCITGAHYFHGKRIRTVEGHARRDDGGRIVELSPVQQAFLDHFSFQCGYCTPGFVNAATVLLERLRQRPVARAQLEDAITEALNPHLCRCTGYVRYYEAVRQLALDTPGLVSDAEPKERGS